MLRDRDFSISWPCCDLDLGAMCPKIEAFPHITQGYMCLNFQQNRTITVGAGAQTHRQTYRHTDKHIDGKSENKVRSKKKIFFFSTLSTTQQTDRQMKVWQLRSLMKHHRYAVLVTSSRGFPGPSDLRESGTNHLDSWHVSITKWRHLKCEYILDFNTCRVIPCKYFA